MGNELIGPGGQPLHSDNKDRPIIVIKIPVGVQVDVSLLKAIAQTTGGSVIVIPPEYDVYSGKLAIEQLANIHNMLHTVLRIDEHKGSGNRAQRRRDDKDEEPHFGTN